MKPKSSPLSTLSAQIPTKRLAIDKAQAQTVGVVAAAAFVTIFCLVAAKGVLSQNQYQARVTSKKEAAHKQLQQNIQAFCGTADGTNCTPGSLVGSYKSFDSASPNIIGGNADGTGDNDGTNSKIILDALPPSYDFPALTASIEKIVEKQGLKVASITGTDDQVNQQGNVSSPNPSAVNIPFSLTISGANYSSIQQLVNALQNSIRPMVIDTLALNGSSDDMTIIVGAHTFYQPGKNVSISQKVVK